MLPRTEQVALREITRLRRRQKARIQRPFIELLEDRTMLDSGGVAGAIVIGRTLATPSTADTSTPSPSYFMGEVQNNQVTITLTVYNEQADPETGVLVTDTLAPGVTLASSSQPPDQHGQALAWSLGTIQGDDWASVSMTVNLPSSASGATTPVALDTGASAYAMLDAAAVSATTPAATVQPGNVSDPSLLASTVDADTNDPFIQEEAAALDYDPTQIFNFLHNQIGFNAYAGSVRGARGTLWSGAGNALDVASLGVALMRASGIPAQYATATLTYSQAQTLVLSMFPAAYQTVGDVPAGTVTADPADDYELIDDAETYYWFQFDTGSGMTNADPLMPGATIGQSLTTATGTFTAIPQDLEETTEIQLVAEIYSQASAALGAGDGLSETTVLDQTFDDDYLVGRPISVGNFVTTTSLGFLFTSTTDTYQPYINIGDEAYDDGQNDQVIDGTPYQEVLTNFPLGSQVLTGLFLNVTLSGSQGPSETYQHTILDEIGYAARQGLVAPSVSVNPLAPPPLNDFDITTVNVLAGLQDPNTRLPLYEDLSAQQADALALEQASGSTGPATTQAEGVATNFAIDYTRYLDENVLYNSDVLTGELAPSYGVVAYWDRPRVIIASQTVTPNADMQTATVTEAIDLLRDNILAEAYSGQATSAVFDFNVYRGFAEDAVENAVAAQANSSASAMSAGAVFTVAQQQGIPLVLITTDNLASLASYGLDPTATARITTAVEAGEAVLVPAGMVSVGGQDTSAWFQIDPTTGDTTGVMEDGNHQGIEEEEVDSAFETLLAAGVFASGSFMVGLVYGASLQYLAQAQAQSIKNNINRMAGYPAGLGAIAGFFFKSPAVGIVAAIIGAFVLGVDIGADLVHVDPELPPELMDLTIPLPTDPNTDEQQVEAADTTSAGVVAGSVQSGSVSVSGTLSAAWNSSSLSTFLATGLAAGDVTVTDASGATIGTGIVALDAPAATSVAVSGNDDYAVSGTGTLAFYGPAETALGVGGDWDSYSATITGGVSITITTDGLSLNGTSLPAGTYTISGSSISLSGSGATSSLTFAGSASITATGATLNLGAGSGTLSAGGKPLDPTIPTTLDGYSGTIAVAAGGSGTDSVTLSGTANNVLQVTTSQSVVSTDQNTPITFATNLQTSLADTYNVTVKAPAGWTVSIDASGNVTVAPAPGLQSGTYPIQIIAQSQTDAKLEAQTTVELTITPTQPGMNLSVAADPIFTVPFNGAALPTAFRASIQNLGPAADTYSLTFSNVPIGFTVEESATSVTVPAGETGIVGVYLVPNTGQPIPPPGTQLSFTVTATSQTTSTITQSQTVTFTVPSIDAVTVTATPSTVNALPGGSIADTITFTNVGNVAENNITLSDTLPSGLTLTGLTTVSLAVGQSTTETITLTPDASTPLNTDLQATITATYGSSSTPATQSVILPVDVVAPGVPVLENAVASATRLGNSGLASQLGNLAAALTSLVQSPTSAIYLSQAQASLTSLISQVTGAPFVGSYASALTAAQAALGAATTPDEIDAAVTSLGTSLGSLAQTLSDEALYGFTISLPNPITEALPGGPMTFEIDLTNNGTAAETYNLTISSLPADVSASFSTTSVTVQPGQTLTGTNAPTVTLTESGETLVAFSFTVTATAQDASEITQGANGQVTLRNESIAVATVTPNPPYTAAGGSVDVTAGIQGVVNEPTTVSVSYTVTDSNGDVLLTSTPVTASLSVSSGLVTVDMGSFGTTGFTNGTDTITVTVVDQTESSVPSATGQGTVEIGIPLTAVLTTSPTTVPTGTTTVTNTLQVTGQMTFSDPLTFEGSAATSAPGTSVALYDNYAYESGTGGISIFDITDPKNPTLVNTITSSSIVQGSLGFNVVRVVGDDLYVATTTTYDASEFNLLVYSLADPENPTFISNTPIDYAFLTDLIVNSTGTAAFVPTNGIYYYGGGDIFAQTGTFLSINLSDPTSPTLGNVLFNSQGPTSGGLNNENGAVLVNDQVAYVASTSSTGGNTQSGEGELQVVNISDPSNLSLTTTLAIPDTNRLIDVAVQGDYALVVGDTGGWLNPFPSSGSYYTGNVTLTLLNITDPSQPAIIGSTLVTPESDYIPGDSGSKTDVVALGNGDFLVSDLSLNPTTADPDPVVLLVDPTDPDNLGVSAIPVPSAVHGITVSGDLMYATTAAGLSIYQVGSLVSEPLTLSVQVPTGSSVMSSFNAPPTSITTSNGVDTLTWDRQLAFGSTSFTFTWQSTVSNIQAGQTQDVTLGTTANFTDQGTPGTVTLPATTVTGQAIIQVTPASQTAQPGASATYDVRLTNPSSSSDTYYLSVTGLPYDWTDNLAYSVTVPAQGSVDVPLTLTSGVTDAAGTTSFTVTAQDYNGVTGSASASLTLAGSPVLVSDANSYGVVATLTPAQATAGQGTSAQYVIQLTNTGSVEDSYSLAVSGLPADVYADLGSYDIEVPPGAGNFRDVTLTLSSVDGTTPGTDPFTVTATSDTESSVSGSASGTVVISSAGVQVYLNPSSVAAGSPIQATITNTGSATDTFNLSLGGPAALAATLAQSQVTLGPGASQTITITTTAAGFSLPGSLPLIVLAQSQTDPSVESADTATLTVPTTQGLTASFEQATQTLSSPGVATFLLMVQNTGNTQDSCTATIVGANGPVTASLVGLDGAPTQSIPTFTLPALSSGVIELQADIASAGQGTIMVQVQSQTTSQTIAPVATAILSPSGDATSPTSPGSTSTSPSPTSTLSSTDSPTSTSTPTSTSGPHVKKVQRYGYHMMPTTVVLTFNQALDPSTAEDVHNYRIVGRDGHRVKVKRAVYDAAALTVTLHFDDRLSVHHPYMLTVIGAGTHGLSSVGGQPLDSAQAGEPGGDERLKLTSRDLVLGDVSREFLIHYHIGTRHSAAKAAASGAATKAHPGSSVTGSPALFTRSLSFAGRSSSRGPHSSAARPAARHTPTVQLR